MKRLFLILTITFCFSIAHSQNNTNDLTYLSVKINYNATTQKSNFKTSNKFNYNQNDSVSNLTGSEVKSYEYYENLYLKAKNQRNVGISLTFLSIPITVLGIIMNKNSANSNSSQNGPVTFENIGAGGFFIIGGDILFNVGVPLWISGSIKAKNNKVARDNTSAISFEVSSKGLGVQAALHF